ncbi:unnamed protein product [Rhodiola kirilowii]
MDMQNDFHRLFFFEDARKTAEATYIKNPLDAGNLTSWGEALLELSQLIQNFQDLMSMIRDAISKLDEALVWLTQISTRHSRACIVLSASC